MIATGFVVSSFTSLSDLNNMIVLLTHQRPRVIVWHVVT